MMSTVANRTVPWTLSSSMYRSIYLSTASAEVAKNACLWSMIARVFGARLVDARWSLAIATWVFASVHLSRNQTRFQHSLPKVSKMHSPDPSLALAVTVEQQPHTFKSPCREQSLCKLLRSGDDNRMRKTLSVSALLSLAFILTSNTPVFAKGGSKTEEIWGSVLSEQQDMAGKPGEHETTSFGS